MASRALPPRAFYATDGRLDLPRRPVHLEVVAHPVQVDVLVHARRRRAHVERFSSSDRVVTDAGRAIPKSLARIPPEHVPRTVVVDGHGQIAYLLTCQLDE